MTKLCNHIFRVDYSLSLTSYPEQYRGECIHCGRTEIRTHRHWVLSTDIEREPVDIEKPDPQKDEINDKNQEAKRDELLNVATALAAGMHAFSCDDVEYLSDISEMAVNEAKSLIKRVDKAMEEGE